MNGDAPRRRTVDPARSDAVRKLLDETRRALEFDRAHVVLVADGITTRALPGLLATDLRGEIETVTVRLVGSDDRVSDCVASALRNARSQMARPASEPGAPRRARRALVLPDALAISAASLRRLREIASRADASLRLVLLVDRDSASVPDPARELVSRLGTGVSKIELDALPSAPRAVRPAPEPAAIPASPPSPKLAPPIVDDGRRRPRMRPIPVRRRPRRGLRALAWLAAGALLAGAALLVTAPSIVHYRVPSLLPRSLPDAAPDALPEPGGPPTSESDGLSSDPGLPPVGLPDGVPPPSETASAAQALASEPGPTVETPSSESAAAVLETPAETADTTAAAAPSPEPGEALEAPEPASDTAGGEPTSDPGPPPAPTRIAVAFNASPWAEIEVDGRSLGPTPVGDVRLAPGEHRLRATFPDGRRVERRIRVDALRNRFRIDPGSASNAARAGGGP